MRAWCVAHIKRLPCSVKPNRFHLSYLRSIKSFDLFVTLATLQRIFVCLLFALFAWLASATSFFYRHSRYQKSFTKHEMIFLFLSDFLAFLSLTLAIHALILLVLNRAVWADRFFEISALVNEHWATIWANFPICITVSFSRLECTCMVFCGFYAAVSGEKRKWCKSNWLCLIYFK